MSSWFISPILAGIMAVIMYSFLRKVILFSENKGKSSASAISYSLYDKVHIISTYHMTHGTWSNLE